MSLITVNSFLNYVKIYFNKFFLYVNSICDQLILDSEMLSIFLYFLFSTKFKHTKI